MSKGVGPHHVSAPGFFGKCTERASAAGDRKKSDSTHTLNSKSLHPIPKGHVRS